MTVAELTIEARPRADDVPAAQTAWYDPDSASFDDAPVATAPEPVRRDARSRVLAAQSGPDPLHGEWG